MLNIQKGEPWVFWPSSICETFPENPANIILSGDKPFQFNIDFILKEPVTEQNTVFTLIPKYTGLDLFPTQTVLTVSYEDKTEYYRFDPLVKLNEVTNLKFIHKPKSYLKIFINNIKVVDEDLNNRVFGICESPHIVFGAGNFPKNNFNLNYTELDLLRFSVFEDSKLVADHFFEERIFDKYVDITGNLNFVHKL